MPSHDSAPWVLRTRVPSPDLAAGCESSVNLFVMDLAEDLALTLGAKKHLRQRHQHIEKRGRGRRLVVAATSCRVRSRSSAPISGLRLAFQLLNRGVAQRGLASS